MSWVKMSIATHHWIRANIGGEGVLVCDQCGKSFGETEEQEDPIICFGAEEN